MPDKNTLSSEWFLSQLQRDYPDLDFVESNRFSWHAGTRHISYSKEPLSDERGIWALLHELGHALLEHADYSSDIELLHIEVAAWEKARQLALDYSISIDEEYIQDSLDSYRDWLHIRSTCPRCHERSLQLDILTYRCHNCGTEWHISRSRLCRPYRKTNKRSLA